MERYILVDTLRQYPLELEKYPEAQDDDELVRLAVKKNGLALQFASQRLRDDFETVMIAVKKSGNSLEFASGNLQDNLEIVMAAVQSNGNAYRFASERLHKNLHVIIEATRTDASIVEEIPVEFLSNNEIARNLISIDPLAIGYLDEAMLMSNVDLMQMAVARDSDACMYLPESIWACKDIIIELVEIDAFVIRYALENSSKIDKDIALTAMKGANSSWGFRELPRDLQRDPDVLRAFVSNLDEDAREGILCRINLPNAVLQDDDFIRNIVDFCSCCETCPYDEPVCIWRNGSLIARAQELCDYSISIESDEDDWFEEDEEE
jgi:hypothetical protein